MKRRSFLKNAAVLPIGLKTLAFGQSSPGAPGAPEAHLVGAGENRLGESRPAHMLIAFTPAGKVESFFREVAVQNGPKMDADVFRRFDMEMVGPPLTG